MTSLAQRRALLVAGAALLIPTFYFWASLVLKEMFGVDAWFDPVWIPLDRSLLGKLGMALLVFAMPSIAVLCAAVDLLLRRGRGESANWMGIAILGISAFSMAAILYHGLTDR
jgi:hypothetical protein